MFYQFHGAELKLQFIATGIKNSKNQFYVSACIYWFCVIKDLIFESARSCLNYLFMTCLMQWIISELFHGRNKWSKCKILAQILEFPTSVENMGWFFKVWWEGGRDLTQYMRGVWDGVTVKKYLWKSSFDSKVAGYKPANLQIY